MGEAPRSSYPDMDLEPTQRRLDAAVLSTGTDSPEWAAFLQWAAEDVQRLLEEVYRLRAERDRLIGAHARPGAELVPKPGAEPEPTRPTAEQT